MECRKKADKERQTLFTIRMTSEELTNLKAKIHFSFLDNHGKLLNDKESEDICNFTGNDQGWSWNIPYKYLTELTRAKDCTPLIAH
ncbi:hypothetical protein TYRP_022000 [Tyrophagus putrescentiae]|nr:hypothetical protein TYRP_022000 [Tyrophagus putrescentiae]